MEGLKIRELRAGDHRIREIVEGLDWRHLERRAIARGVLISSTTYASLSQAFCSFPDLLQALKTEVWFRLGFFCDVVFETVQGSRDLTVWVEHQPREKHDQPRQISHPSSIYKWRTRNFWDGYSEENTRNHSKDYCIILRLSRRINSSHLIFVKHDLARELITYLSVPAATKILETSLSASQLKVHQRKQGRQSDCSRSFDIAERLLGDRRSEYLREELKNSVCGSPGLSSKRYPYRSAGSDQIRLRYTTGLPRTLQNTSTIHPPLEYATEHASSNPASNTFEGFFFLSECARTYHSTSTSDFSSSLASALEDDCRPTSALHTNALILANEILHIPTLPSTQQRPVHLSRKSYTQRGSGVRCRPDTS